MPLLTDLFRTKYLESLHHYKSFYDDLYEYGNPKVTNHAFYFVPGFNGTPGQIRFALSSLVKFFGPHIYLRCLWVREFSAREPIWEKYTAERFEKKRAKLVADLIDLSERFEQISLIVSSSGFYEFLSAFHRIPGKCAAKIRLAWIACAPPWSKPSPWEKVFYRLNGFHHNGHLWFAYPNHNWLKFVNGECTSDKKWRFGEQRKTFFKNDLESRFYVGGLMWDYLSFGCYNWVTENGLLASQYPLDLPAVVMVATDDGYWQGKPREEIDAVIHTYLTNTTILYRKATHLWVTVPENITAMIVAMDKKAGFACPTIRLPGESERWSTHAQSIDSA